MEGLGLKSDFKMKTVDMEAEEFIQVGLCGRVRHRAYFGQDEQFIYWMVHRVEIEPFDNLELAMMESMQKESNHDPH